MQGFDWRMLLSGAWFETIAAALLAILVLATGYRPPWWFWTRNYNANAGKCEEIFPESILDIRDISQWHCL